MRLNVRDATLFGLTLLLIAAVVGFLLTRDTAPVTSQSAAAKTQPTRLVEQSPLETAHNVASIASTAQEQKLAAEAYRIADHEVDMAFASALQVAELHPPAQTSATKELNARI